MEMSQELRKSLLKFNALASAMGMDRNLWDVWNQVMKFVPPNKPSTEEEEEEETKERIEYVIDFIKDNLDDDEIKDFEIALTKDKLYDQYLELIKITEEKLAKYEHGSYLRTIRDILLLGDQTD